MVPATDAPATVVPTPATTAANLDDGPTVAKVQPGDNLAKILQRHQVTAADVHALASSEPYGERLTEIFPGHQLEFSLDDDGNLMRLKYRLGRLETLEFKRSGNGFEGKEVLIEPERVRTYTHAVIQRSLYEACQSADLSDAYADRIANIFQWDVDFILDTRAGDEFHLLYNRHYIEDQFVGLGDILAVEIINRGKTYRAVRYETDAGRFGYFTPEGRNMRKAFRRSPLEYSRISSNFNLNRIHPLWKSSMPHRGIDYAAPPGTPVKAAGDGEVLVAGKTRPNGNYIVLQHGSRYQTKYLHLSRFAASIRKGKQVQQGDTIGYVGMTGWATGPHLHYEFLVNGVHQNPRTVPLPSGDPVPKSERETFVASAALVLSDLEAEKTNQAFVSVTPPTSDVASRAAMP